ncbi:uncharacterized protein LOC106874631 [Octopus bimaculoides]|uniref:CNNM transmembrane domain-containing protein n=1 Tax=Octopus bimaculoides TaxID=37653 RepID=A0A0L8IC56_OCTBM|nr:uncharacterized protein LOC106874631 [Octopus bimaculoides]|eukprot:XP_014777915.1 PREDICTED: putative DUF21 domain-containing protein At1g03270 [Octopus bimaculoides]
MSTITCNVLDSNLLELNCSGIIYNEAEPILTYRDKAFWMNLGIYVALILIAGLMSGLTIGFFSLDMLNLLTLRAGGTAKEQKYANIIIPLVKKRHLLLVTLLLTNSAAVEAMPIFLNYISDPVTAIIVSTTGVLIFGEIIPQAFFSHFGLSVGAILSPIVYFLIGLLFIICWPISKVLDCLFGKQDYRLYQRKQLKALIDLHKSTLSASPQEAAKPVLSNDEVMIIKGALDMKTKTAEDAMLTLEHVVMLSVDDCMDYSTIAKLSTGHSRIPIYQGCKQNILGVLLVKNLILLDPKDCIPVYRLIDSSAFRSVPIVPSNTPLFDLLNLFQTGKSHLCIVREQMPGDVIITTTAAIASLDAKIIGIITLEDVIEELIQEEIVDETEVLLDINDKLQVSRSRQKCYNIHSLSKHDSLRSKKKHQTDGKERDDTLPPGMLSNEVSVSEAIQQSSSVQDTNDTDHLLDIS